MFSFPRVFGNPEDALDDETTVVISRQLAEKCVVFGSDFPHSEGLPDPVQYAKTIEGLDEALVKTLMRDNLARFMRLDA